VRLLHPEWSVWLTAFVFSVSSAIVQRYLPQILEAAMTRNVQMQAAAVDILGFTVKQGLAHPLQVKHLSTMHAIDADHA
jgi:Sister chromatid cohesion C-terminus